MLPRRFKKPRTPPAAMTMTLPAPVGGLNARDALAAMPPTDAVTLDNWFPGTSSVDLRRGYDKWSTGYPAAVESLMVWNGPATSKLFAASGTAFYDATSQGAVGAAVVSGLTNARWQTANMGTPGGQFLYCVNGVDYPQLYNGTAWTQITGVSTPSITGVDPRKLVAVNIYKTRVFFVEKDSARCWYLPVNSVGGAAASLDFSSLFVLGGYLVAMATWTIDNAAGVVEYAVFISSEGEVIMYTGTDPSSSSAWSQAGRFRIGRPVGRRCFVRVGSDVIVLTSDGFVPLSKALLTDRTQNYAISDKIQDVVSADLDNYAANFGWEPILYPKGNKLLVNVPTTTGKTQRQYVMNVITGAWCRFTGWNANVFQTMGDVLYFGGNLGAAANSAYVARADYGFADDGGYVSGEAKPAFHYFGQPGREKQITMVRPVFRTTGTIQAALALDMDFADRRPTATPTFSGSAGTLWDTALWGTFLWGASSSIKKDWQGVAGVGDAGTIHMRVVNNMTATQWQAIEYVYRMGGIL